MEGNRSLLDSRKGEGREGNRDSGGEERKKNHDQLLRHRLSEFQLKCRFIYGSPKKIMMALFFLFVFDIFGERKMWRNSSSTENQPRKTELPLLHDRVMVDIKTTTS